MIGEPTLARRTISKLEKHTVQKVGPAEPAYYTFNLRPRPKERPRFVPGKNGRVFTYTPARTRYYEDRIQEQTALQHPGEEPWTADLTAYVNLFLANRNHGDIDNLAKAILDGMQGVAFKNDKSVKGLHVETYYITDKNAERSEIILMKRLYSADEFYLGDDPTEFEQNQAWP